MTPYSPKTNAPMTVRHPFTMSPMVRARAGAVRVASLPRCPFLAQLVRLRTTAGYLKRGTLPVLRAWYVKSNIAKKKRAARPASGFTDLQTLVAALLLARVVAALFAVLSRNLIVAVKTGLLVCILAARLALLVFLAAARAGRR